MCWGFPCKTHHLGWLLDGKVAIICPGAYSVTTWQSPTTHASWDTYCWWKKSCTSWYVVSPSIYQVYTFQVIVWDFLHQQYHRLYGNSVTPFTMGTCYMRGFHKLSDQTQTAHIDVKKWSKPSSENYENILHATKIQTSKNLIFATSTHRKKMKASTEIHKTQVAKKPPPIENHHFFCFRASGPRRRLEISKAPVCG